MPSAPLGVSSQSRKRLKTAASGRKSQEDDENKENQDTENAPSLSEGELLPPHPPHTPAVRIPIEDLIANTEDAFNCAPPVATPGDHVRWQSHPDSSNASLGAGATQRSRKRAHSSSPVSSQQLSAQKDALNLDTLNKSLRTPNNDPTQDLWNRYTTANGHRPNANEPTLPAYSHLLPSSPQTPSTSSKDSGLRRTHSCGVEWPTSKSKRRRIDEQHSRTKELFAASRKDILRRDLSNNTRVGLLLERIQESLAKKVDSPESPSSSSPLPDRRSQALVSPTRPPGRIQGASRASQKSSPLKKSTPRDASFSSDFSDDVLDIEALECIEQVLAQTQAANGAAATAAIRVGAVPAKNAASQSHTTLRPFQNDGADASSQPHPPKNDKQADKPAPRAALDSDEFDDDDDDEDFMNEMMDIAARYDSQPQAAETNQLAAVPPTSQARTQSKHLETLDEFEDAFDDDDELWGDIAVATSERTRTPVGSKNVRLT